jgi:nucleoside-diphosphate-sugar epimerase
VSRIVVTGATGFIGRHLVEELATRGHEVVCLVRRPTSTATDSGVCRLVVADLLDPTTYAGELPAADHVVHRAGWLENRRAENFRLVNVEATQRLVEACRQARAPGGRFVLMSSVAAMGPAVLGGLLRETDPCRPVSEYGRSKRDAEIVALSHADALGLVVLRPSFVYGPGDQRGFALLPPLLPGGSTSLASALVGTFSVCHVADVVGATLLALGSDAAPGETLLISNSEVLTWERLRAIVTAALAEIAPELAIGTAAPVATPVIGERLASMRTSGAAARDWACDTARARRVLGFVARVPLNEGIRKTLCWYRDQGWLGPAFAGLAERRKKEAS